MRQRDRALWPKVWSPRRDRRGAGRPSLWASPQNTGAVAITGLATDEEACETEGIPSRRREQTGFNTIYMREGLAHMLLCFCREHPVTSSHPRTRERAKRVVLFEPIKDSKYQQGYPNFDMSHGVLALRGFLKPMKKQSREYYSKGPSHYGLDEMPPRQTTVAA